LTSFYFEELFERYASEIDDLRSDSEGRDVLKKRLRDKRGEFPFLVSMIDVAPEMVAPVFHRAFEYASDRLLASAAQGEPGDGEFPAWEEIAADLEIEPWAQPLITTCLEHDGGDFLVTTAVLEWLLGKGMSGRDLAPADKGGEHDEDEDGGDDLGEAGEGWLSEQGFDALDR
jgi:hypothetical protein